MFKIDQKVPLPPRRGKGVTKYPWLAMKVGDSFFVAKGNMANLRSSASQAGRRYNMTFTGRAVDGGVRVWRVK